MDTIPATPSPSIFATRRFDRAYRRASVPLQRLIEGATHDIVRRYRESPATAKRGYDRLAQLTSLLEVDVSGGNRMVADLEDNCLHLLDVGNHEIVPQYKYSKYTIDKHQKVPVHAGFWPEGNDSPLRFFSSAPCTTVRRFGDEFSPEWLYYLSAQQAETLEDILNHVFQPGGEAKPVFLVGGPGTGKTSVLLNLLKRAIELGANARMSCSARMKQFILASTPGINPDLFLVTSDYYVEEKLDLVIVDDPETNMHSIIPALVANTGRTPTTPVIGFDPCQTTSFDTKNHTSGLDDTTFDTFIKATQSQLFGLDECYRQKRNVGEATLKSLSQIAQSTPFLARQKIARFLERHAGVNSLSLHLTFPNPMGYVQTYPQWSEEHLERETERIRQHPNWTHWPSTLAVIDTGIDIRPLERRLLAGGIRFEIARIDDVKSIKGLEYQHLLLFITKATFDQLEGGLEGAGQAQYARYRLMRIPLSRSKDSLATFVTPLRLD